MPSKMLLRSRTKFPSGVQTSNVCPISTLYCVGVSGCPEHLQDHIRSADGTRFVRATVCGVLDATVTPRDGGRLNKRTKAQRVTAMLQPSDVEIKIEVAVMKEKMDNLEESIHELSRKVGDLETRVIRMERTTYMILGGLILLQAMPVLQEFFRV